MDKRAKINLIISLVLGFCVISVLSFLGGVTFVAHSIVTTPEAYAELVCYPED